MRMKIQEADMKKKRSKVKERLWSRMKQVEGMLRSRNGKERREGKMEGATSRREISSSQVPGASPKYVSPVSDTALMTERGKEKKGIITEYHSTF